MVSYFYIELYLVCHKAQLIRTQILKTVFIEFFIFLIDHNFFMQNVEPELCFKNSASILKFYAILKVREQEGETAVHHK